ncbi:MAG: TraR/DksA family transcriptional regulator [Myxococcota bacterium]
MTKRQVKKFKDLLIKQRGQITRNASRALDGEIHLDRDDIPDELDLASSESALSFTGRLRAREATLLQKIDRALEKIEEGEFGICESCGEKISVKRLEARPVAELCIDCKVEQERSERTMAEPGSE